MELSKNSRKEQKEGEVFLAENKTKEGVKTLASGYSIRWSRPAAVRERNRKPRITVTTTTGHADRRNGVDSSYSRGKPATFQVGGVIRAGRSLARLWK